MDRLIKPVATKKHTNKNVVKWMLNQTNFSDSVIYLIEQEIYLHGIRNVSAVIPANRPDGYFDQHESDKKSSNFTNFFSWLHKKK